MVGRKSGYGMLNEPLYPAAGGGTVAPAWRCGINCERFSPFTVAREWGSLFDCAVRALSFLVIVEFFFPIIYFR